MLLRQRRVSIERRTRNDAAIVNQRARRIKHPRASGICSISPGRHVFLEERLERAGEPQDLETSPCREGAGAPQRARMRACTSSVRGREPSPAPACTAARPDVIPIAGYTDRLSAAPGERIAFKVSSMAAGPYRASLARVIRADPNPAGPGA